MDTAGSPAVLWIEKLVSVLQKWKRTGSLKDKESLVGYLVSTVNRLKYSYLEPEDVAERFIPEMRGVLQRLLSSPLTEKQRRFAVYVLEEVEDLPRKLRLRPSEPFQVFRYRFVEVVSVSKHRFLDLLVTRVRDRYGVERTVITNIGDINEGQSALIVLLPPKEFKGVWSEGMYVKIGVFSPSQVREDDLRHLNTYFNVDKVY